MRHKLLLFALMMGCQLGSNAQGTFSNFTSNGQQYYSSNIQAGWTPWANGQGDCNAPDVGPGGWRIVGGSLRQYSDCSGGYATAQIYLNPGTWYIAWSGITYGVYDNIAAQFYAFSDCADPTDSTGNYAADTGDTYDEEGC